MAHCTQLNRQYGMQIAEQKEAAIRGLSNYMFMEAQRMAKVVGAMLHDTTALLWYVWRLESLAVLQEGSGNPTDKFQG